MLVPGVLRWLLAIGLVSALRTGKVVRRSAEPWLFAQRFCFRGGNAAAGGEDKTGKFKYRVKSYGLVRRRLPPRTHRLSRVVVAEGAFPPAQWMLIFTEDEFESFKKIQESDYTDMTMQERFDRASIVQWVGHNESDRVTSAAPSLPAGGGGDDDDGIVVDTSFWKDLYDLYDVGGNVDSSVPWSETRGEIHFREDSPTWFYVVFANFDRRCNTNCEGSFTCNLEYAVRCYGRIYVRYNLQFKNGGPEELDEFSYDEAGLVAVSAGAGI